MDAWTYGVRCSGPTASVSDKATVRLGTASNQTDDRHFKDHGLSKDERGLALKTVRELKCERQIPLLGTLQQKAM